MVLPLSSRHACSTRSRIRKRCGASPAHALNCLLNWLTDSDTAAARSASGMGSASRASIISRTAANWRPDSPGRALGHRLTGRTL
jgi:hypothetical protein